jgi:hypothetical protein
MLANAQSLPTVEEHTKSNQAIALKVIENNGYEVPEGLKQIKAMLNDTRRSPAHLYNKVLNTKQRTVLCFAAGLTRAEVSSSFQNLSANARIEIQKSLLLIGQMFEVFRDANALSPAKFLDKTPLK